MKFPIPLMPFTVTIERRPFSPLRSSVLDILFAIVLIAVPLGYYVTHVYSPARRLRYERAGATVKAQLGVLTRAVEADRLQADRIRGRHERLIASAKSEREKTLHCPPSERAGCEAVAALWDKAINDMDSELLRADASSRRADVLKRHIDQLAESRSRLGQGLEGLERFAREVTELPDTPAWRRMEIASYIEEVKAKQHEERRQGAIAEIVNSRP
jgi:hypothetical protein